MTTLNFRFSLLLLVGWLAWGDAPLASAAPAGASRPAPRPRYSAADKKEARRLFFKGARSFAQRNYPDALAHYNASYRLVPKNVVLYNIAMCHRALFEYTKAIRGFRKYLKRKGRRLPLFKRRKIERMIAVMDKKLGRLKLKVEPAGSKVRVDGRLVGTAPLSAPIGVDPGRRVVEVSHPDRRTATLSLSVLSGQLVTMGVKLQPLLRDGRLVVTCASPRCRVRVDGGPPLALPVTLSLRAGMHGLRVSAPAHLPQRLEVQVYADETVRRQVKLVALGDGGGTGPGRRRTSITKTWWFWTVLSAAVVAVGTTTGLVVWDQTRDHVKADVRWQLR